MKRIMAVGAVAAIGAGIFTSPAAVSAAPQAKPAASTVTWGACPEGYPTTIQCSSVSVPLDYAHPGGKKIDIVISRAKATGTAAQRQGVLFVNRGGPGGTGVAYAQSVQNRLPDALKKTYDVIGFDPRGVGLSHPIYCVDPATFYKAPVPDPIPTSRRDLAINTGRAAYYASGCLSKNGSDVKFYNTPNTARDMDVIRAALGEQKINYLGYSYGTYLGAVYATLFPTHARRFILDSAVDPTGVWYDDNLGQNVAFDKSFHEFLRWIASNDATFHLGSTEAKASKAWYATRAALKKKPAGGVVGAAEFDNAGSGSMYSDAAWQGLAQAVSDYVNKHDDAGIIDQYGPTDLAGENGNTIYTTVGCNDKVWPHNLQKWYSDAAQQYKKYPFLVYGNMWFNMPCAFWPYGAKQATRVGSTNVPDILVINATGDPATPYPGALKMHQALRGSKLVTVTGQWNHGQYLYQKNNTCTLGYGNDYLLTGNLPKHDVSCVGDPHPPLVPAAAKSQLKAQSAAANANDLPGRAS